MSSRRELSLESVREFILFKGGKVTNHDLVKHFKDALTNPDTRAEARNEFKEIVNTLATIVRSEEGEKYLILKKRYRNPEFPPGGNCVSVVSPTLSPEPGLGAAHSVSSLYTPATLGGSISSSSLSHFSTSQDSLEHFFTPSNRQPPPYRPPPPPVSPTASIVSRSASISSPTPSTSSTASFSSSYPISPTSSESKVSDPPPVPPRRRSSEKIIRMDSISSISMNNNNGGNNKENINEINKRPKTIGAEAESDDTSVVDAESKVSVKECMQKFNKLASESALQRAQFPASGKKKSGKETPDRDEEDSVSLDPKAREWQLRASQSNYQALAKMAGENHRLTRLKCPFTGYTALHWAAKHGNEDVVKLLAGTYKVDVNSRTNGGYTPLHMAMQFGHEDIYNLLVQVYGADSNLRDWSGRKPRQYQTNKDTTVSADTFRSEYNKGNTQLKTPSGWSIGDSPGTSLRKSATMPRSTGAKVRRMHSGKRWGTLFNTKL